MATGTDITETLAAATSDALMAAGITRRDAADRSGIPITTLQRRLTGRSPLNALELDTLAKLAGTTVRALVVEAERRLTSHAGDGTSDVSPEGATSQVEATTGSAKRTTKRARRTA